MTPAEIQAVQEAWKVDPECAPALFRYRSNGPVVRDALHRRILERGAWVEPFEDDFVAIETHGKDNGFTRQIAESDSLIVCMARAVIALQESPDA